MVLLVKQLTAAVARQIDPYNIRKIPISLHEFGKGKPSFKHSPTQHFFPIRLHTGIHLVNQTVAVFLYTQNIKNTSIE